MDRLPTLFISHGSPMCALRDSPMAGPWAALARDLPRPRAVLAVSAHWETELPMVSTADRPDTLHDFGGFPHALYRIRYSPAGAPDVARCALDLLMQAGLPASAVGCRGLDHGAWVPLLHMYPQADVPVFQVSLQTTLGTAHHLRVGAALAPLADQGVLIVGSGSVTHNLRDWRSAPGGTLQPVLGEALPYVREFTDAIDAALRRDDLEFLSNYRERAPHAVRAHPSEEHFLPLLVARAAAGRTPRVERIAAGADGGAIGMDTFVFHPGAGTHAAM